MPLQSSAANSHSLRVLLPAVVLAGVVGEISFEAYAWFVSPILFGPVLEPANLVIALTSKLFGLSIPYSAAFAIHFSVGAIAFPVAILAVHLMTRLKFLIAGVVAGVLLWYIAQGMLAPFIGRSFMMDFGAYTQSSFVGHVGMAIVMALVFSVLFGERKAKR